MAFWILLWLGYKASLFTMDDISFAMEKISLSFRQVLLLFLVHSFSLHIVISTAAVVVVFIAPTTFPSN